MMTPLLLLLSTGEELQVLMSRPRPDESMSDLTTEDIVSVSCMDEAAAPDLPENEIAECVIKFAKGTQLLCHVSRKTLSRIGDLDAVVEVKETAFGDYTKMQAEEDSLDRRLESVKQFINNFPRLSTRVSLHKQYIKRKAAFIAALEALVDSSIGGA